MQVQKIMNYTNLSNMNSANVGSRIAFRENKDSNQNEDKFVSEESLIAKKFNTFSKVALGGVLLLPFLAVLSLLMPEKSEQVLNKNKKAIIENTDSIVSYANDSVRTFSLKLKPNK